MTRKRFSVGLLVAVLSSEIANTEASIPVVTMSVTTPDGRTQDLTAPESSVARLTLKDGTEYEFRPTIQDSFPWNRIIVTIFKGATSTTLYGAFTRFAHAACSYSCNSPPRRSRRFSVIGGIPVHVGANGRPLGGAKSRLR